MFFFGTKTKSIRKGTVTNVWCDYCDTEGPMGYDFRQKYFHLYFIPFIPLKRKVEVCCESCHMVFEEKDQSSDIEKKLNRVKDRHPIRTPVWSFSGIILLGILTTWAFWQSGRHDVVEADYIKNPKKGDVYFIESESNPKNYTTIHTTWRVDKVDEDNVYITRNDTSVTKYTKVFAILNVRYYTDKKDVYPRKKIEELYKKDSIISVTRD